MVLLEDGNKISSERVCVCTQQGQEVGQASELRVSVVISDEALLETVDSAARSILVDKDWFVHTVGSLPEFCKSAMAADRILRNATGTGVLRLRVWEGSFIESVLIMATVSLKISIGIQCWLRYSFKLNYGKVTDLKLVNRRSHDQNVQQITLVKILESVMKGISGSEVGDYTFYEPDVDQFSENGAIHGKMRKLIWRYLYVF